MVMRCATDMGNKEWVPYYIFDDLKALIVDESTSLSPFYSSRNFEILDS